MLENWLTIEKMTKFDSKELAWLDKQCFAVPWSEKSFQEEAENKLATYLVAKDRGKIVGYCGVWRVSGEGQITNIAVLSYYRQKGIASLLLKRIVEECSDMKCITLEVRESNEPAIRLYEKNGFVNVGLRKNYYRSPQENAIIMTRGEI